MTQIVQWARIRHRADAPAVTVPGHGAEVLPVGPIPANHYADGFSLGIVVVHKAERWPCCRSVRPRRHQPLEKSYPRLRLAVVASETGCSIGHQVHDAQTTAPQ